MINDIGQIELNERGIYIAHTRLAGAPIVYAVDADGDRIVEAMLKPGQDLQAVIDALWNYLDAISPARKPERPRLEVLVGGDPQHMRTAARARRRATRLDLV